MGSTSGADARAVFDSDGIEQPADLPPECCGRCEHCAAVTVNRGVCRWPPPPDLPLCFAAGLVTLTAGAGCPCFTLRAGRPASEPGAKIERAGEDAAPGRTTLHQVAPEPRDLDFDGPGVLPLFGGSAG